VSSPETGFESMLTGGHPNLLGRTLEVVELVLADAKRLPAETLAAIRIRSSAKRQKGVSFSQSG
jgi:hypothetical protein